MKRRNTKKSKTYVVNKISENLRKGTVVTERYLTEFDKDGNLVREAICEGGRTIKSCEYKYYYGGDLKEIVYSDGSNKECGREEYISDSHGRLLYRSYYGSKGGLKYQVKFRYNEMGQKVWEEMFDRDWHLISTASYNYDAQGVLRISMVSYKDDPFKNKFAFYDEKGMLVESYTKRKWEISERKTMEHDDKGQLIKEKTFDIDGTVWREVCYSYDMRGRVVESHEYVNGEMVVRNIWRYR